MTDTSPEPQDSQALPEGIKHLAEQIRDAAWAAGQAGDFATVANRLIQDLIAAAPTQAAPVQPSDELDARRFRYLCSHPDWAFIESLCRQFVAESEQEFYEALSQEIDRRAADAAEAVPALQRMGMDSKLLAASVHLAAPQAAAQTVDVLTADDISALIAPRIAWGNALAAPQSAEARKPLTDQGKEAARYRWLRDFSEPGICAFYLSVGQAFKDVKFTRETVDEAIDAQIAKHGIGSQP